MFSPDGHWIAYASVEFGITNVYAQPFPPNGLRTRLSTTTGYSPQWTADGKHVIYSTTNFHYMSVDVSAGPAQPSLPEELFVQPQSFRFSRDFAMDAKGERFVLSVPPDQAEAPAPITVVINWTAGLNR